MSRLCHPRPYRDGSGTVPHLGGERVSGGDMDYNWDLLCVDVPGIRFAIRWGRRVTDEQQQRTAGAWVRCAGEGVPVIPPAPMGPTESLPFSASVAYVHQAYDGGTFALQAASFEADRRKSHVRQGDHGQGQAFVPRGQGRHRGALGRMRRELIAVPYDRGVTDGDPASGQGDCRRHSG